MFQSCVYCHASGRDPDSNSIVGFRPCPVCKGHITRSFDNLKFLMSSCKYCSGTGRDPNTNSIIGFEPCPVCEGWGGTLVGLTKPDKPNSEFKNKEINRKSPQSNKVFIVHGHDDASKERLARFLSGVGLIPIILHEQPNRGRTIIQKFEEEASDVGYAFVLMTPDDLGIDKETHQEITNGSKQGQGLCFRPRQNVVLELGFFYGKLGRGKVCCLIKGNLEKPSDFDGILYLPFRDRIDEVLMDIIRELKDLGYKLKFP